MQYIAPVDWHTNNIGHTFMLALLFTIDFTMMGPNKSRQMEWNGLLPKFNLSSGSAPPYVGLAI